MNRILGAPLQAAKSRQVVRALGWSLASALVAWGLADGVPAITALVSDELGHTSLAVLVVVPAVNTVLVWLKDIIDQARAK